MSPRMSPDEGEPVPLCGRTLRVEWLGRGWVLVYAPQRPFREALCRPDSIKEYYMKTVLKIATILTWFNLVMWLFIILFITWATWKLQFLPFLFIPFLLIAIILNCYAALRLQRSLRYPAIPLSSQTPTGIGFIGIMACSFALVFLSYGYTIITSAPAEVRLSQTKANSIKELRIVITKGNFQCLGTILIFICICTCVNVILNYRLLQYYFARIISSNAEKGRYG